MDKRPATGSLRRRVSSASNLRGEVVTLLERGLFDQAAECQEKICAFISAHDMADTVSGQLIRLAEIRLLAGRPRQALVAWLKAREYLDSYLRDRSPRLLLDSADTALDDNLETARLLNRLGLLEYKIGCSVRARVLLLRALAIARDQHGVGHADRAILLTNLATIEHDAGRFEEAESLHRQALEVLGTKLGEDHPEIVESQIDFARFLHQRGNRKSALRWFDKALRTLEKRYGADHPVLIETLCHMAELYFDQGEPTSAEQKLERALEILKVEPLNDSTRTASQADIHRSMVAEQMRREIREIRTTGVKKARIL